MDYANRIMGRSSGFLPGAGGAAMAVAQPSVGAGLQTNFGVQGNATGPALVLIAITVLLVLDYVWTRGQQGGR